RPLTGKTEITRHELTLDAEGFVVERRYRDQWDTARYDADGSYGQRYINSSAGLVLRGTEIDGNRAAITLKTGVRAVSFVYDSNFQIIRETLSGSDDQPFDGPGGFAYDTREYDRWGNNTAISHFSANDRPILNKEGFAKIVWIFDAKGDLIETSFLDAA